VVKAVVFDLSETLVDETWEYGTWADWLGVPRHTFSSVFGAVIALGKDYREAFQYFRPGFSLDTERARRAEAGQPETRGKRPLPGRPTGHGSVARYGCLGGRGRKPDITRGRHSAEA
jgi:hypothetical protein